MALVSSMGWANIEFCEYLIDFSAFATKVCSLKDY